MMLVLFLIRFYKQWETSSSDFFDFNILYTVCNVRVKCTQDFK